jgi:hypothetical protein
VSELGAGVVPPAIQLANVSTSFGAGGLTWKLVHPGVTNAGIVGHTVPACAPPGIVTGVNPGLLIPEFRTAQSGLSAGLESPAVSG